MKILQGKKIEGQDWVFNSKINELNNPLVLIFGNRFLLESKSLFDDLKAKFPTGHLVFGSTSGEIIANNVYDNSITLTAIEFEKSTFEIKRENILTQHKNSKQTGLKLFDKFNKKGLKHLFIISEGSFVNEANAALENFKQIRIKKLYNQLVVSKDYNQISSFIKTHPNYPNIEKLKARQSRFTKIVTKKAQTVSYKALGWPKPMTGEELMMLDKEDEKNRIINMHGRMTGGLIVFTRKYLHVLIGNGTIPGIDDTLEPVNITYQMLRNDVPKISSISEKGFFVINRLVVLPVGSTLNIKSVFVNNGIIDQGVIVLGEKKAILKSGAIQYLYNN